MVTIYQESEGMWMHMGTATVSSLLYHSPADGGQATYSCTGPVIIRTESCAVQCIIGWDSQHPWPYSGPPSMETLLCGGVLVRTTEGPLGGRFFCEKHINEGRAYWLEFRMKQEACQIK